MNLISNQLRAQLEKAYKRQEKNREVLFNLEQEIVVARNNVADADLEVDNLIKSIHKLDEANL